MAKFYGSMKGGSDKTSVTRQAHHTLEAHIRGWNEGVKVELYHKDGFDCVRLSTTAGSNGGGSDRELFDGTLAGLRQFTTGFVPQ